MSWIIRRLRHREMEVATGGVRKERKGLVTTKSLWTNIRPYPKDLANYETYYKTDSETNAAVNVLADMTVGVGYYTECENDAAKEIVDRSGAEIGLDQILLNVIKSMLVYGFCPVERYFVKGPPKGVMRLKVLPSRTVKIKMTTKGKVLGYVQKVGAKTITFSPKEIIWFVYNKMGTDPYGTSIVAPILSLLDARAQTHTDMPKIIHRYSSPLTVWESSGTIEPLKKGVMEREPDEDIFVGQVSKDDVRFSTVEMDPRGRFTEYIKNIDDSIIEGLQAPILGYLRNATEASATKMLEVIDRHVTGIQRYVKRMVEGEVFTPLLALHGIGEVPSIRWGVPQTGLEDVPLAAFLSKGLEIGYLSQAQFLQILKQMGLHIEEEEGEE